MKISFFPKNLVSQVDCKSMTTIFQKIINKEITAEFLHEDDICIGIMDIDPKAPFHALIIPKQLIARIGVAEESEKQILGHLLLTAKKIASEQDLNEGFNCQTTDPTEAKRFTPARPSSRGRKLIYSDTCSS